MFCTKCGGGSVYKSGFVKGEQRYRCKGCGRQFVPTRQHGKTQTEKLTAILLYINGLSLRTIARLMSVTATAVLKWVKQYALENYEKPQPQKNNTAIVRVRRGWALFEEKKTTNFGFGRYIVALPISSLTGNAGVAIAELFKECLIDLPNGM